MKEIFEKRDENRVTRDRYKLNLKISRRNQVTFGTKSLKFYGPKIWNALQGDHSILDTKFKVFPRFLGHF